jgi:hypothetical protein
MPDDNEVIEPTLEQSAQADTAEEAAFAASFGEEVRADNAPTENDEQIAAEQADSNDVDVTDDDNADAAQAAGASQEEVQEPSDADKLAALVAKMPKLDELENMTQAEIRKVHGKIGEINRAVQELQKNQGNTAAVKLAGVKLTRLAEEYPELANVLAQDLSESGAEGGTTQPTVNVAEEVAKVREDLSKEMQANLLTIQHRDWHQVIKSPEFADWKQTLPEADRTEIDNSWNAMYLGEKLTAFKAWHTERQTGASQRRQRMERATTPRGSTASVKPLPMSEEDGFNAAFR